MQQDEHGPAAPGEKVVELVTTKSDAETAADLKRRFEQAVEGACAIMDEAVACKMQIHFDGFVFGPPFMKHRVNNLRIVKVY